ncbi:hypothetical protein K1T35_35045 [Pseudonocardia sp. DSM 110487]|uniref:hypothetical protein n=1 Tax=Pseudonocardia sp. DSM 110487 TaxID=2865833 RepID=UPI001C6A4092|nr:hypothetical protein [Pseudonocardia sp. DSM 110487]QYN33660.1 hypothetical protein K1T35_35045 [Pseudonocardia sp. DSM 110487]
MCAQENYLVPDVGTSVGHTAGPGVTALEGFAPGDLTSPARALRAGALVDVDLASRVTELRIHGVSGSNGSTVLEHPATMQVAGDRLAGFHRRWTPAGQGRVSVPWRAEAYSWGGLTQVPLASASWILLAPFMLYNVAHFMLPPRDRTSPAAWRNRVHDVADGALRLLALAATLQMVVATLGALLDTVALQGAEDPARLPVVLTWLGAWAGWARGSAALVAVALVVGLLWVVSVRTANRYEARDPAVDPAASTAVPRSWPMAEPAFWQGKELVDRQRTLHVAAALGSVAVVGALPGPPGPGRLLCVVVGGGVVLGSVLVTMSRAVNRYYVAHRQFEARLPSAKLRPEFRLGAPVATKPRRIAVLAVAAASVLLTVVVDGITGTWDSAHSVTVVLETVWVVLTAAQALMLVVLGVAVTALRPGRMTNSLDPGPGPYLRGHLCTVVVMLAVVLGGLLSAVVALSTAGLFGGAAPSSLADPTKVAVPWPLYAFAAAPLSCLVGAVVAGLVLGVRFRSDRRQHEARVQTTYHPSTGDPHCRDRLRIARAWAVGDLADGLGRALAIITVGGVLAVGVAASLLGFRLGRSEVGVPATEQAGGTQVLVEWIASAGAGAALLMGAVLVALLRSDYADSDRRRTIGAVWDVGTFWPRAAHPLAPPCYAERAVPEVVDRIAVLTGCSPAVRDGMQPATGFTPPQLISPTGPVLLTGYSQGSVIAPAVVAQLPADVRERVALLTLACPLRRLYGRAFPAFFGGEHLRALAELIAAAPKPRWTNAVRRSDYIGSWVGRPPDTTQPCGPRDHLGRIDVWCRDPVALVPDTFSLPLPIHRHSGWWPDPQVGALADELVDVLDKLPDTATTAMAGSP